MRSHMTHHPRRPPMTNDDPMRPVKLLLCSLLWLLAGLILGGKL